MSARLGSPSPAQDYVEAQAQLALNEYCIRHPSANFFIRAKGDSMIESGILSGGLLIVDKTETPTHDDNVISSVGDEFAVKRLCTHPTLCLRQIYSAYLSIFMKLEDLDIFGVVIHAIHTFK
ncbi:peptidase [Rouxiella badensis]|nr:peptidase [Rouxiella badensis]